MVEKFNPKLAKEVLSRVFDKRYQLWKLYSKLPVRWKIFRSLLAHELYKVTWDLVLIRLVRLGATTAIADWLGQQFSEKIIDDMFKGAGLTDEDLRHPVIRRAKDFANLIRRVNLYATAIPLTLAPIDTDIANAAGRGAQAFLWGLGLGWLSWATLSPLVRYEISKPVEDYLKEKLRPEDWPRDVYEKLYVIGDITLDQFKKRFVKEGIPDELIEKYTDLLIYEILSGKIKDLLRVGAITEDEIKSRVEALPKWKGKWKQIRKLLYKELSKSDILKLRKLGKFDDETAKARLIEIGYSKEDAELILATAHEKDRRTVRRLSMSQILRLVREGLMDEDTARKKLAELGYSDEDINYLIELAKAQKKERETDITVSEVRRAFLLGIINEKEASIYLKKIGLSDERINLLLEIWNKQKEPHYRRLSLSLIRRLYEAGIITQEQLVEYIQKAGYHPEDARKLALWIIQSTKGKPRRLTLSILSKAYRLKIISREEFIKRLIAMGYSPEDAEIYATVVENTPIKRRRTLTPTQICRAFREGILSFEEAATRLLELGYDPDDAAILLALYTPKKRIIST